eukprot:509160-Rhodomonas_salina.3
MGLPGMWVRISVRVGYSLPIGLRACYAVSGTDLAYAATRCAHVAPTALVWSYARATRCPVLVTRLVDAMSGTYLSVCCYGPTRVLYNVRY